MKLGNLLAVVALGLCSFLVFSSVSFCGQTPGDGAVPALSAGDSTAVQAAAAGGGWVRKYPGGLVDAGWHNPRLVAADGAGNVIVTGKVGVPMVTLKYDNSGNLLWEKKFRVTKGAMPFAMALDDAGNIYITGEYRVSEISRAMVTIKYNPSGILQWARYYSGAGSYANRATSIAVDAAGNVHVTGHSKGTSASSAEIDFVTIKYDTNGVRQWVRRLKRFQTAATWEDYRTGIAVDGAGNVYVAGNAERAELHATEYITMRYSAAGVRQWVRRYSGASSMPGLGGATSIALDGSGGVYVTGQSAADCSQSGCPWVIDTLKYDGDGELQWVGRSKSVNVDDYLVGPFIAVGRLGGVYVAGITETADGKQTYVVLKYDLDGAVQWRRLYYGPSSPAGMVLDASDNVYVTGTTSGTATGLDFGTVKYGSDGVRQWSKRYSSAGDLSDYGRAIAVDAVGNTFVTGNTHNGPDLEWVTVKIPATAGQAAAGE